MYTGNLPFSVSFPKRVHALILNFYERLLLNCTFKYETSLIPWGCNKAGLLNGQTSVSYWSRSCWWQNAMVSMLNLPMPSLESLRLRHNLVISSPPTVERRCCVQKASMASAWFSESGLEGIGGFCLLWR